MSQTIVEAKGLCLNIGRKVVLDDINTAFLTGESVLIAGRNGAGKSTFLRCLIGVILPDRGEVSYAESMDRDKIGFISDRVSLLENLTLKQGMDFHSSAFHIADFDDSLITKLNLDLKQKIKHLSAGERVLFHLALIVAQKPEILLVDEIIHTIDTYMRTQILDALIDLMDKYQTTVIMVNHTFSEVEKIPERILIMEKGRFILDEKTEDLRAKIVGMSDLLGHFVQFCKVQKGGLGHAKRSKRGIKNPIQMGGSGLCTRNWKCHKGLSFIRST